MTLSLVEREKVYVCIEEVIQKEEKRKRQTTKEKGEMKVNTYQCIYPTYEKH